MRPYNEQLAERILEEAKKQFLEKGYSSVTVRSIAADVGVTTGAIYKYYKDKEALFDALVSEPAETMLRDYKNAQDAFAERDYQEQIDDIPNTSKSYYTQMLRFMYDHFDAFKLISCCATGTKYENYIDRLAEIEDQSGLLFTERMKAHEKSVRELDFRLIHILSTALFNGMFETIRHDIPREKAMEYVKDLQDFYSAGWLSILGIGES